jgi:hypothetical protein
MFSAWLVHDPSTESVAYTAFPGTKLDEFLQKQHETMIESVGIDGVSGVYDRRTAIAMAIFWQPSGGSFDISLAKDGLATTLTISATGNIAVIFRLTSGDVTVADPSQRLSSVSVTFEITFSVEGTSKRRTDGLRKTLKFDRLPTGGLAGSSATRNLYAY